MSDRKENINFNLYEDIKKRTNGEIYLGVVGPVRTDICKKIYGSMCNS